MSLGIIHGQLVVGMCLLFFIICGKNKNSTLYFVIGNDTLSIEQFRMLDPAGENDSVKIRNAGMRLLWAQGMSHINEKDTLVDLFSERLLLHSGTEWSRPAVALLLKAAQNVAKIDDSVGICIAIKNKNDSICSRLQLMVPKSYLIFCADNNMCDTIQNSKRQVHVLQLQKMFGISSEIAGLCYDFAFESAEITSQGSMTQIVAGLVASVDSSRSDSVTRKNSTNAVKNKITPSAVRRSDAGVDALRYRDEKSIRDSIEKHIPNIQQLYKKTLKTDATIGGKVIVTIQVKVDGSIADVKVKTSDIQNREFLDQFMSYMQTVRFKPVPRNAGDLTFDFPFEFNAEM